MTRKAPGAAATDTTAAVDAFMATLEHPHKPAIEALRAAIVGADRSIAEGVKWNAPSFRTTEYFATVHLRAKEGVALILHLGAKARAAGVAASDIKDPGKLLTWLGKDRAMLTFRDTKDVAAKRAALQRLVKQWIARV